MLFVFDAAIAKALGPAVAGHESAQIEALFGSSRLGGSTIDSVLNSGTDNLLSPIINTTLDIVSTSSGDDAGTGTGAFTVRITGIDANNAVIYEDFVTDGAVPVVGSVTFKAINDFRVTSVGSFKRNGGTISASKGGTVYAHIGVYGMVAELGAFTVPAGKWAIPLCLSPVSVRGTGSNNTWQIGAFYLNSAGLRTFLQSIAFKRQDNIRMKTRRDIVRSVLVQPGESIILTRQRAASTGTSAGCELSYILMDQAA